MSINRKARFTLRLILVFISLVFLTAVFPILSARFESARSMLAVNHEVALAIDNVNIISMSDSQVLRAKQLLLKNGKVWDIRPAGSRIAAEFKLVDGQGAFILPGLIDMHVHILDRSYAKSTLAYGVTTVRNMGGFPMHLRWKDELREGEWLGSDIVTASPIINGIEYSDPYSQKIVTNTEEARKLVRRYKKEGYDFIKVYESLSSEVYAAILEEAKILSFPVAGHPSYDLLKTKPQLIGELSSFEHVEEIYDGYLQWKFDELKLKQAARKLAEMKVALTPTLAVYDHLTKMSVDKNAYITSLQLEYINPLFQSYARRNSVERWLSADSNMAEYNLRVNQFLTRIVKVLQENNVKMILGSDTGAIFTIPGQATHWELQLLQASGLSAFEALKSATINAAQVLGRDQTIGSVEKGKNADLIIVKSDPLDNLAALESPFAVIKNGQWLGSKELQLLKQEGARHSSKLNTFGRLLEFYLLESLF
ncbi:amidohydrolase family protein [Aliikangiella sp. G2MR2-5]|uniref:amidohydrolase family protein n=1 Tax=Aliikangiella sp. G2MR2-5 TaxID=2788943 RepID=UPI0018AA7887|nr:amidohydrolase family protein [Aliikangiella sp. G2MR2-5]